MWAIGVYDFGLPRSDVFKITPAQFFALAQRNDIAITAQEFGFGMITSMIANAHFTKKGGGKFEASDFMPDRKPQKVVKKSGDDLLDYFESSVLPKFKVVDLTESKETKGEQAAQSQESK